MPDVRLRRLTTADLVPDEFAAIRAILWAAFDNSKEPDEGFTEHDWDHALGGTHVLAERDGRIVAHASVVPREIHAGNRPLAAGYVEAVATKPDLQRTGLGTSVMREIGAIIDDGYEAGFLGTGELGFYGRLGWVPWRGPLWVRAPGGDRRTPDEDGFLMVLRTRSSPPFDLNAPLSCDWRAGDVW
jgi:aminoglycoside 2'-N-acetyltransferase I